MPLSSPAMPPKSPISWGKGQPPSKPLSLVRDDLNHTHNTSPLK